MTKEETLKQLLATLEKVWNTPSVILDRENALNNIMESYCVYRFSKAEETSRRQVEGQGTEWQIM